MSDPNTRICPRCGYTNAKEARYCNGCGYDLLPPSSAGASTGSHEGAAASTMFGVPLGDDESVDPGEPTKPVEPKPVEPKTASKKQPQATMMGMPMSEEFLSSLQANSRDEGSVANRAEADAPKNTDFSEGEKTIETASPGRSAQKTMMGGVGIPGMDPAAIKKAVEEAKAAQVRSDDAKGEQTPDDARKSDAFAKTEMDATASKKSESATPNERAKRLAQSNRTMLGAGLQVEPLMVESERPRSKSPRADVEQSFSDVSIAGMPSPRKTQRRNRMFLLMAAALLLVGAGFFVMRAQKKDHPLASLSLVRTSAGAPLQLHVEHAAPDGTNIEIVLPDGSKQQGQLTQGKLEVQVPETALRLGENSLELKVLPTGEDPYVVSATLRLEYRVTVSALERKSETEAALAFVFETTPGSTVQIGEASIALDAQGRGTHSLSFAIPCPVSTESNGGATRILHYKLQPSGKALIEGDVSYTHPCTSLSVAFPQSGSSTDAATVALQGRAQAGARVTVASNNVPVDAEGKFEVALGVPSGGDSTFWVRAEAPGLLPSQTGILIHQRANLLQAMARAIPGNLSYAALLANPSQERSGSIDARIYNVDTRGDRTVLQVLAKECASDTCPLWVEVAAPTPPRVGDEVRIFGRTRGTHSFRTQSGQERSVPKIEADAVVPVRAR